MSEKTELTPVEQAFAQAFGMDADEYAAHRTTRGAADWNAKEARRKADAEHERLNERESEAA
jgi:hypothetical protein